MASKPAEDSYKLISSDNKEIIVSEAVIKQNDIWAAIYECGGKPDKEIPIKDIDGKMLKKVVLFCEKFVKDPAYDPNNVDQRALLRNDPRVINYFKDVKSGKDIHEILAAANYLINQRLIDACLLHVHRNLEGMDIEGIRTALHLTNDFTPEEERAFKQRHNPPFGFNLAADIDLHHYFGLPHQDQNSDDSNPHSPTSD